MSNNVDNIKEAYKCDSACHTEFLLLRVQSKHFTQSLVHSLLARRRERIRLLRGIIIGSLSLMAWTKICTYTEQIVQILYDNIVLYVHIHTYVYTV